MTPGLGVVLSFLLLAPGFAAVAGYYLGAMKGPVRQAPAPPNSFLALAAITFGALVAHTLAALVLGLNAAWCAVGPCLAVPWEPNLYVELLRFRSPDSAPGQATPAALLVSLLLITATGFIVGGLAALTAQGSSRLRSLTYGWTVELAFSDALVVTAFVVSDVSAEGAYLGYEGIVQDLKIGADGEIKTLSLSDCGRFLLKVTPDGVERTAVDRALIPFVMLEAANIKNIALNPYFGLETLLDQVRGLTPEEAAALREAALLDAETAPPDEARG